MDILGIGYLMFEALNPAEWRAFGTDILGMGQWTPSQDNDGTVYLTMDDRRYRIAIQCGSEDRLATIGWEIKNRTGFEDALRKLERLGVAYTLGDPALCQKRGVFQLARFSDPVGYQHEIFFAQKWGYRSFVPSRPGVAFDCGDDGDQGIGHVVLAAPSYDEELENFLKAVLGFSWYGYGGGPNVGFWNAKLSKRSHVIAYVKVPGMIGIQHLGIFARSLDDVGMAYDAVLSNDIPLQQTLGRHVQDPIISFYVQTPTGCALEYCWEFERFAKLGFETIPERISLWGHKRVGPIVGPSVRPVKTNVLEQERETVNASK
jgi:2,3-dihydroxybiphenyl 1,2-dioxygenase